MRLTFESLVCVARLTARRLVLPPPSSIEHLDHPFHETQAYDAAALSRAVDFVSAAAPPPEPTFAGSLGDLLLLERRAAAPSSLVLDPHRSRLQHFECLPLSSAQAREAARAVLELGLRPALEREALEVLRAAGLSPGAYDALHLRRGDFARTRPETQWTGAELLGRVRRAFPERHAPLLVACVTAPGEEDPFPALAAALTERPRVLRSDSLLRAVPPASLRRALLDTWVLALAARFVGTPDSTFSTGVWHWRARARVLRGELPEEPASLGEPPPAPRSGDCWQRCTRFEALRGA